MSHVFLARRLDVQAFAQAGATLSNQNPLSEFERLLEEAGPQAGQRPVVWSARGEMRLDAGGFEQPWVHLEGKVNLPLICQRCLGEVDLEVAMARSFRFVATEAQAEDEDEEAEEDVLALSRDFDLLALLEDELLMAQPLVPRHETCPTEVKLSVQDPDFEAAQEAKPKPFAALAGLKGQPGGDETGGKSRS